MASCLCCAFGCPWRLMPHDVPNWRTVLRSFREWKLAGIWEQVHAALQREVRVSLGRDPEPSAAVLDSPSITTRSVRDDARGYDGGKTSQGRKRRLLVDTQGLPNSVNVLAAAVADRDGGKACSCLSWEICLASH